MLYVSWGFHIKGVHRLTWLEPLMLFLNPWRLSLLFLVSGVATRFMLDKSSLASLAAARSARLLIPLIFGMLAIVPPQSYLQIVESLGYPAGFFDFYDDSGLSAGIEACIVIVGTALICVVTCEAVRRIAWLRPLFGLRAAPRTVARMEQHQPA